MKPLILLLSIFIVACSTTGNTVVNLPANAPAETELLVTVEPIEHVATDLTHIPVSVAVSASPLMSPPAAKVVTTVRKSKLAPKPVVEVDAILDQLSVASIAFNVPRAANIEDKITVTLVIDPTVAPDEMIIYATGNGITTSSTILISPIVSAVLIADEFNITKITPEQQAIAYTGQTTWAWEISPKSAGNHTIRLTVNALVTVDGTKAERHINTFDKIVSIEITKTQKFTEWATKYAQWAWTTILLPLIVFAWKKYRSKV